MYGAGITNNIIVGLVCFAAIVGLMGMAVPLSTPMIQGVYADSPADMAGLSQNSVIYAVNGMTVESVTDVSDILKTTAPGDALSVTTLKDSIFSDHTLILGEWPEGENDKPIGFMGIQYYSMESGKNVFNTLIKSPLGPIFLLVLPINTVLAGDSLNLGILAFDVPYMNMWDVPFSGFWGVIQILFWIFWFNLLVGTFNALPFIPLDGGYIMQEGVGRLFEKLGRSDLTSFVVSLVSALMISVILLLLIIPYMFG